MRSDLPIWSAMMMMALLGTGEATARERSRKSEQKLNLALRETEKPTRYRFRVAESSRDLPVSALDPSSAKIREGAATAPEHRIETETIVEYRTERVDPLTLRIATRVQEARVKIDGQTVTGSLAGTTGEKTISIKGYRTKSAKSAADFDKFDFVLPITPVSVGDSWTYTAPPTADLPVYVETQFKLTEIKEIDGQKVAVIQGTARTDEQYAPRAIRIRVEAKAQVLFGIPTGQVIRSEFNTRLLTVPRDPEGKLHETRTYSLRELLSSR